MVARTPPSGWPRISHDQRMDDDLRQVLDARWSLEIGEMAAGSTWVEEALEPVILAAAADPDLRALFPFTSHNRLCFSRCSEFPYTFDCPCISAHGGRYTVLATWSVTRPAPVLLETDSVGAAIAAVVGSVPSDKHVWLGNAAK